MKLLISTILIFTTPASTVLATTGWNQLYYVYCGKESSETYLDWYWRKSSIEADLETLKNTCRRRGQSDEILIVPGS